MYSQEITRCHRGAIVIAIDQSCSMSGRMMLKGWNLSKAEAVSMVVGQLVDELILRSHRENVYRDYYDIALIGYSGNEVYPLFGDELMFYPITAFVNRNVPTTTFSLDFKTLNSSDSPFVEPVSLWVEPRAQGATPMYKMINRVTDLVADWCSKEENMDSFPPLVFNVTDGEASDANYEMLRTAAHKLRSISTTDGNTLFMNIHITSDTNHKQALFPTPHEVPLEIRHAHLMMDMSSVVPEQLHSYINRCRTSVGHPPYIAMSYNASISALIAVLNIGSRSVLMGV